VCRTWRSLYPRRSSAAIFKQALSDHLVLAFRGQLLDDDQLMRFSAHFGELDWAPYHRRLARQNPCERRYVHSAEEGANTSSVISNVIENGKAIGALGAYEAIWHTRHVVQSGTALRQRALNALEVPPSAPTPVVSQLMYLAYETLPEELHFEGIKRALAQGGSGLYDMSVVPDRLVSTQRTDRLAILDDIEMTEMYWRPSSAEWTCGLRHGF